MSPYAPRQPEQVAELIREYPLGLVVSGEAANFAATPLPLLPEVDEQGRVVALFGHFARSNPQVAALTANPRAAIIFQGPQGYVSPRFVSNLTWGPTWNYAMVRFVTEVEFVPNENAEAIRRLSEALEGAGSEAWTAARMGARYEQLLTRIIAFRAHVLDEEAKFKLGQDEHRRTFAEIIRNHPNGELTRWMVKAGE